MLHAVPIPYPHETFYSVLARRMARFPGSSAERHLNDILGTNKVLATIEFPAPLDWFQHELNKSHPCAETETLLNNHTLLPWYKPFLPPERIAKITESMLHGNGKGICSTAGMRRSGVKTNEFLRYCPECFRESSVKSRSLYWRRLHQLTGIEVCPTHRVWLEESQVHRIKNYKFEIPLPALAETPSRLCNHPGIINVATLGQELLSKNYPTLPDLQKRYRRLAEKQGLLTYGELVRVIELKERISSKFPEEYLERVGCQLHAGNTWLTIMMRKPRGTRAPIKHLVLLSALESTMDDLAQPLEVDQQINEAPQVCLNPLCPQKGKGILGFNGRTFSYRIKKQLTRWKCGTCGRIYQSGTSTFKTLDYGTIWTERLKQLWLDPTASLVAISKELGLTREAIKRKAWKLKLPFPRSADFPVGTPKPRGKPRVQKDIELLRGEWLKQLAKYAMLPITVIASKNQALFTSLYRRDRVWLNETNAKRKRPRNPSIKVNWKKRDPEIAMAVQKEAERLRQAVPPIWISKQAIVTAVKCPSLGLRNTKILPEAVAAMDKAIESRIDFICRRIAYVTGHAKSTGQDPKVWEIEKMAGLRPELLAHQKIIDALQKAAGAEAAATA